MDQSLAPSYISASQMIEYYCLDHHVSDAPEVMICETRDTWPGTGPWSRICCCCQRIHPRETDSSPPSLIRNTIEQCCDDKVQDPGASNTCQELKPTKKNDYFHLIISFMKHVDMKTVQI